MGVGSRGCDTARAEPRMAVALAAELRTESGSTSCRLVDLSRGGACLEIDSPVLRGREIVLHRGAMQAKGVVVWLRGDRCGVRFDKPIRANDLLVQMSQSRKSQARAVSGGANSLSPSS